MKLPYQTARGRGKGGRMGRDRIIGLMMLATTILIGIVLYRMGVFDGDDSRRWRYDLNRDGKVNSIDATIAYKIANHEWQATDEMIERADVNRDGFVNQTDIDKIVDEIMGRNK